ncbi:MAG: hypothetical protein ACM3VZ_13100 [Acidobacteriota bacterium]
MNRFVFAAAFAVGLAAVLWMGMGFVGANWMALTMTLAIAGVYLLGAFELQQFRAATATLSSALAEIPQPLTEVGAWLERVHPSLQNPVRLRIEGERVALPGPALTPYLVGLLVMLGMLGTFLGMVLTFKGAVFALEGSSDLQAIRSALAAPIKGLGLSFGTSVAGVAASAMLGLISAMSRRERMQVARLLDTRVATVFRPLSLTHQRQETFKALQMQAHALPEVVHKLQAMMDGLERRSEQLNQQLQDQQQQFHREASLAYTGLAQSVQQSLRDSLVASAQAAGDSIQPVVAQAMTGLAQESQRTHQRLMDAAQMQLNGLEGSLQAFTERVEQRTQAMLTAMHDTVSRSQSDQAELEQQRLALWTQSLQSASDALVGEWQRLGAQTLAQQQAVCAALERSTAELTQRTGQQASHALDEMARLVAQSEALVRSRAESEAQWLAMHGQRMDELAGVWRAELAALRDEEASRGQAAVVRLGELQAAMSHHLATLGAALEEPMTRMLKTASEVPQAAAEVIAQLRQEMSHLTDRDNATLQERAAMMAQMQSLMQTIHQASGQQQAMIESMVTSAAAVLERAGSQLSASLGAQAGQVAEVAAHVQGSAVELSSLGEAFSHGVDLFSQTNEKLIDSLQRIEASIQQSLTRSDDQLAYYVAQAREVIDLSITSQQGIVEDLRRLNGRSAATAEGGNR